MADFQKNFKSAADISAGRYIGTSLKISLLQISQHWPNNLIEMVYPNWRAGGKPTNLNNHKLPKNVNTP